ncbi:unnamed protein product [Pleuronectes platessa]|uniref:Uncharacterized protein n=1 Tax=Pleuronectes platessa TaxID=8262 RepID=A0A9N7Y8D2_PLEPL|nr:unnamed protein product [Pleuronectes platessa]
MPLCLFTLCFLTPLCVLFTSASSRPLCVLFTSASSRACSAPRPHAALCPVHLCFLTPLCVLFTSASSRHSMFCSPLLPHAALFLFTSASSRRSVSCTSASTRSVLSPLLLIRSFRHLAPHAAYVLFTSASSSPLCRSPVPHSFRSLCSSRRRAVTSVLTRLCLFTSVLTPRVRPSALTRSVSCSPLLPHAALCPVHLCFLTPLCVLFTLCFLTPLDVRHLCFLTPLCVLFTSASSRRSVSCSPLLPHAALWSCHLCFLTPLCVLFTSASSRRSVSCSL